MNRDDCPLDPFAHLPHLRQRLVAVEQSQVRVTPEVMARWDQGHLERGGSPDWRLPDEAREALRRDFMAALAPDQDLWVFAYGSLMWDPGFYFAEVRSAELGGHQRRFNYRVVGGRGTPEQPGLVLSLVPSDGARCQGLVFRIAAAQVDAETTVLWRREMLRGGYAPRLLPVSTPQGWVQALVFVAHPDNPSYVHDLGLDETAQIVATASGHLGRNRDYLTQLAAQLQVLGLHDAYISELLARVMKI